MASVMLCSFSHRTAKVYLPLSFNVTEANDKQKIVSSLSKRDWKAAAP
jgi:hypothetical protein